MRFFVLSLALGAGAIAIACSSSSSPSSQPSATDAGVVDDAGDVSEAGVSADGGVSAPDTPVGHALTWVLGAMNGAKVTSADATMHFTSAFLKAVPAAQVPGIFGQLAAMKPWALTGFEGKVTSTQLVAILTRGDGQYWRLTLVTTSSEQIDGLLVSAGPDLDPALQSFDAIDAKTAAIAGNVSELAATIDSTGACTATHSLAADKSRALGSQFKLWVLATLADQIQSGTHAWTDTLAIQDQYKSLPSGTFQNQPNGTMLPLTAFAENMISISDNTAADHLLFFVGRDNVETMLTTTKHHDPTQNQPFLSTRELFDLKLLVSPADRTTYENDSIADKRTALMTYDTTLDPRTANASGWTTPIEIDKLEWFATPGDLCNVMSALKTYGDKPVNAEVAHALSINPGLPDDAQLFSYIGYKGGSEPGVLTMSWLLQRASDKTWRFYSIEFNDTTKAINEDAATYVAGAGRALLAK
jgi:beta-lactamase class A